MEKWWRWVVFGVVLATQLAWVYALDYPPSEQQFSFGLVAGWQLWLLRTTSLLVWLLTVWLVARTVEIKVRWVAALILLVIPASTVWWMSYPWLVVRLGMVAGIYFLIDKYNSGKKRILIFMVGMVGLSFFNLKLLGGPNLMGEAVDLNKNQQEVVARINSEDGLKYRIELPILVRRVSYNKYFFAAKNLLTESLKFWDMESIFFQEVHPTNQKSNVLFFWPTIWLVGWAIVGVGWKKLNLNMAWLALVAMAWLTYMQTEGMSDQRLSLIVFPIVILLAKALVVLWQGTSRARWLMTLLLILFGFGWANNLRDRFVRSWYWLDNRPLVYKFWFEKILENNWKSEIVEMPDMIGPSARYCKYYVGKCDKFLFGNYDLNKEDRQEGVVYAGFEGNYWGQSRDNLFRSDLGQELIQKGFEKVKVEELHNTVSFGYGNKIFVAKYVGKK